MAAGLLQGHDDAQVALDFNAVGGDGLGLVEDFNRLIQVFLRGEIEREIVHDRGGVAFPVIESLAEGAFGLRVFALRVERDAEIVIGFVILVVLHHGFLAVFFSGFIVTLRQQDGGVFRFGSSRAGGVAGERLEHHRGAVELVVLAQGFGVFNRALCVFGVVLVIFFQRVGGLRAAAALDGLGRCALKRGVDLLFAGFFCAGRCAGGLAGAQGHGGHDGRYQ